MKHDRRTTEKRPLGLRLVDAFLIAVMVGSGTALYKILNATGPEETHHNEETTITLTETGTQTVPGRQDLQIESTPQPISEFVESLLETADKLRNACMTAENQMEYLNCATELPGKATIKSFFLTHGLRHNAEPPNTLDIALILATAMGDIETLTELVALGADMNTGGGFALPVAIEYLQRESANWLVDHNITLETGTAELCWNVGMKVKNIGVLDFMFTHFGPPSEETQNKVYADALKEPSKDLYVFAENSFGPLTDQETIDIAFMTAVHKGSIEHLSFIESHNLLPSQEDIDDAYYFYITQKHFPEALEFLYYNFNLPEQQEIERYYSLMSFRKDEGESTETLSFLLNHFTFPSNATDYLYGKAAEATMPENFVLLASRIGPPSEDALNAAYRRMWLTEKGMESVAVLQSNFGTPSEEIRDALFTNLGRDLSMGYFDGSLEDSMNTLVSIIGKPSENTVKKIYIKAANEGWKDLMEYLSINYGPPDDHTLTAMLAQTARWEGTKKATWLDQNFYMSPAVKQNVCISGRVSKEFRDTFCP